MSKPDNTARHYSHNNKHMHTHAYTQTNKVAASSLFDPHRLIEWEAGTIEGRDRRKEKYHHHHSHCFAPLT